MGAGAKVTALVQSDVVLAHPSGNQFFRHLAEALRDAGRLAELCTCIDWRSGGVMGRSLPRGLAAELARRNFSETLGVSVATHSWREWARLAAGRAGVSRSTRHETGVFSVDAVYHDFDTWVGRRMRRRGGAGAIYAYEDAAEASFRAATDLGWAKIYDLPIAYWETSHRLLAEEAQRWPEWEFTLESTRNSEAKLARKTRELELADTVVCPSRFVAESLPAETRARKRVVLAPFGSPPSGPVRERLPTGGRLRVLFAGSMTQRKGLADLLAALRLLNRSDIELVILGSPVAPLEFYRGQKIDFTYEAPRPHGAVLELMRGCDVLCLPSIVEGRALVIQEAMSQGMPVVVTPNTGTDDVIVDGVNGFRVPIRNPERLAERLVWCADHREALVEMGRQAQSAAAAVSWTNYGEKILAGISGTVSLEP